MATIPNKQNPHQSSGEGGSLEDHTCRMREFRKAHPGNPITRLSRGDSLGEHTRRRGIFGRLRLPVLADGTLKRQLLAEFVPVPPVTQRATDGGSRQAVGGAEYSVLIPMWKPSQHRFSPN